MIIRYKKNVHIINIHHLHFLTHGMEYASILNNCNSSESFTSSAQSMNPTATNTGVVGPGDVVGTGHLSRVSKFLHTQNGVAGVFVIFIVTAVCILLPLVLWISALYLSYTCNAGNGLSQALSVVVAFFFPIFYLIFYLIYHSLLGNKCN